MASKGMDLKDKLIADGTLHRFAHRGKGDKDCWYVFFGMAGVFGDWSRCIYEKWSIRQENLSPQNKEILFKQIEKAQKRAEEERAHKYEEASLNVLAQWDTFCETGSSSYLSRKKVDAFGIRFDGEDVVIPLRDATGKLWSLQRALPDGTKRFMTGGRKKGCFHVIGAFEDGRPIYVTEGYATGASVHMATHHPTVIAFDVENLDSVVEELRKKCLSYFRTYPSQPSGSNRW